MQNTELRDTKESMEFHAYEVRHTGTYLTGLRHALIEGAGAVIRRSRCFSQDTGDPARHIERVGDLPDFTPFVGPPHSLVRGV